MKPIAIRITADFLCPWCWIGQLRLARAIRDLGLEEHCTLTYAPYRSGPPLPAAGLDWQAYRISRFGSWPHSQAHDADVIQAGNTLGLVFDFPRIRTAPNTLAAHRLVWLHQRQGRSATTLSSAIFKAHFSDGEDIGNPGVLAEIAQDHGHVRERVAAFLAGEEGEAAVMALERDARADGIASIPTFHFPGTTVTGAQPPRIFSLALMCDQQSPVRRFP